MPIISPRHIAAYFHTMTPFHFLRFRRHRLFSFDYLRRRDFRWLLPFRHIAAISLSSGLLLTPRHAGYCISPERHSLSLPFSPFIDAARRCSTLLALLLRHISIIH
jgi:hypothetical protein